MVHAAFPENAVFRVDHFLAKQTVLNLLGLRFANRVFEPVWNALHVERVDIIWDETLGLEGRAGYYDTAGALRDMLQNHLLQLLALVAMEPPPRSTSGLCGTARSICCARFTRRTETFAELTLLVDNWRWSGVPFRLRSGKALGRDRREILVAFQPVPHLPFAGDPDPDVLRLSLDPDSISLQINLNGAGDWFNLEREELTAALAGQQLPPYSVLLLEVLNGDPTLCCRVSGAGVLAGAVVISSGSTRSVSTGTPPASRSRRSDQTSTLVSDRRFVTPLKLPIRGLVPSQPAPGVNLAGQLTALVLRAPS